MTITRKISIYIAILILYIINVAIYPPIRADALSMAQDYANYTWNISTDNIKNKWYDKIGWKCYWQSIQSIKGVAYSWGNTDTIAEFDQRIANKEPAGEIHSRYNINIKKDPNDPTQGAKIESEIYKNFAGIDCSGLVSLLWGYSKLTRRNTSGLLDVSYRIPIWDAQQGDAWDSSSHIKWVSCFDGTSFIDGDICQDSCRLGLGNIVHLSSSLGPIIA